MKHTWIYMMQLVKKLLLLICLISDPCFPDTLILELLISQEATLNFMLLKQFCKDNGDLYWFLTDLNGSAMAFPTAARFVEQQRVRVTFFVPRHFEEYVVPYQIYSLSSLGLDRSFVPAIHLPSNFQGLP